MDVKRRLEEMSSQLTATEKKLSAAILADYPFAGLLSINEFASRTKTSNPTISRFVVKLGFAGYQEFQRHLIAELKEGQRSPVDLKMTSDPVEGAYLNGFLSRVENLVAKTKSSISETQFNRTCELLSDTSRRIFIIGGRMSDPVALYAFRHLRQLRPKVYHIPSDPQEWPEYLMHMQTKDILFVVDFRRYQKNLAGLAKAARNDRNAHVILMTDPWFSPVANWAKEVLALPITIGTVWDCYTPAFAVFEAMLTFVAEQDWERTKNRIELWDDYLKTNGDNNEEE